MDYTKPNFPPIDIPGYQYLAAGVLDRAMLNGCVRRMEIVAIEADGTVTVEYDGGSYSNVPVFMHTDYGCRRKEIEGTPEPDEEVDEYFERAHLQFLLGEGHRFRVWNGTGWGNEQVAEKMECLGLVYLDEDEETQVGAVFQIVCNMTEEALRSPAPFAGGWPTYRPIFSARMYAAGIINKVFLFDGFTGELAKIPNAEHTALVDANFNAAYGVPLAAYSYFLTGAIKPKHIVNTSYTDYHFGTLLMEQSPGWGCGCRSEPQGDVHPGWGPEDPEAVWPHEKFLCPAADAEITFDPSGFSVFTWEESVGIYGLNVACEYYWRWPFDTVEGSSLSAPVGVSSRKRVYYPSGQSVTFTASAQASGSQLHMGGDTEDPYTPYQWYVADHSTTGTSYVDGKHIFTGSSTFRRRFSETYPYDLVEYDFQADTMALLPEVSVQISDNLWFAGNVSFFPAYSFHSSVVWNGSDFVNTYSNVEGMAFGTMVATENKLNLNIEVMFQELKNRYAEVIEGMEHGEVVGVTVEIEFFFVPVNLNEVGLTEEE